MKKLPQVESKRVEQMYEDTWYKLDTPTVEECCDCGLIHHIEYKMFNGRILWRATLDRRATNAARKRDGITVKKRK